MSLVECMVEVRREIQVRQYVYPRMVAQGKLTDEEANRRLSALRQVLAILKETGDRPDLHTQPK